MRFISSTSFQISQQKHKKKKKKKLSFPTLSPHSLPPINLFGGVFKKLPHFWPERKEKKEAFKRVTKNLKGCSLFHSFLSSLHTMAIKKPLPCLLNPVIIFIFLVLLPFIQSSSSSFMYPTNMVGSESTATDIEVARFGKEAASGGRVEESEREVPTGPDPLHHNNHPIGH
ncbi:uncharacterized protein LOC114915910 [Cajanus cajan]|uniref:uncharacterized protein LOC114915910 n=1 Tax=Cajanus cajan TaxID=3821 RepID=UPI0010FB2E78|nr:uncharacterized protein LOC114915910 [Cajanus cajan]